MTDDETVTISKKAHEKLLRAQRLLLALEAGGVDNWEGYHESTKEFYKKEFGDDE